LILYAVQLAVNFSWSIIFFRFQQLGAAAVTAVLLSILVAAMILSFRKIRTKAAVLDIPYLLWSLFASYLAIANWVLNK
jgi:tryptophan-rich sensory protein